MIGPGLGRADHTVPSVVRTVTGAVVPIVVDGDGLFAMSWNEAGTPAFLRDREVATVLTPHDGEYALLTGAAAGRDRVAAARQLVELAGCVVLLKGPTTVVAAPDGAGVPRRQRRSAAGHRRHRRRAGRHHRRPARRAASTPVEPRRRGAWMHAEAADVAARPAGSWPSDLRRRAARACSPRAGDRVAARVAMGVGRDRSRRGRPQRAACCVPPWRPPRCGPWSRPTATATASVAVAEQALAAGAEGLCVALTAEGVALREAGIDAPILVLSQQPTDDAATSSPTA